MTFIFWKSVIKFIFIRERIAASKTGVLVLKCFLILESLRSVCTLQLFLQPVNISLINSFIYQVMEESMVSLH